MKYTIGNANVYMLLTYQQGDGSFGALGIGQMDEHNTVVVTPTKVHVS